MTILVNGEPRDMPEGITVEELIRRLGLGSAACAAEVNRALIPRSLHGGTVVREGDRVELVTLVGGG